MRKCFLYYIVSLPSVASSGGCTWVHKHPVHTSAHPCITVVYIAACTVVCSVYQAHLAVNPCIINYYTIAQVTASSNN